MKIMNKIYKHLVITSLLFLSLDVYSELVIKVTQGNDKPTEIAISPIAVGEAIYDQDIGLIIESDLERSGMFKTISRKNMFAYPSNPNGSPDGLTGLCSLDGRVTIMMPHPERVFRYVTNSWYPKNSGNDSGWMRIFRNARLFVG